MQLSGKFDKKSKQHSGFTLLELLVVFVIIGVMVSLISLNIGAKPSTAKQAAVQLQSLLELAKEEAILKGQILGLKLTKENYAFYFYKTQKWQELSQDKLLHSYPLHPELEYQLILDTAKVSYNKDSLPQIVLLPDGSVNNFELIVQLQDRTEKYKLYPQQGKIKTQALDEDK